MFTDAPAADFGSFLGMIQSEALRAVAQHWQQARGDARLPSFRQLRPASIAAQLPIVWIYSYDRAADRFAGRLAGDRIAKAFGKSFRGVALEEVHPSHMVARVHGDMLRTTLEPCLYHCAGKLFRQAGRIGTGERIMLPLADDGVHGNGILGASDYVVADSDEADLVLEMQDGVIEVIGDDIAWIPLA